MSAATARLFVALDLPEQVADALVTWRAALQDPAPAAPGGPPAALHPVRREALHVTLCFLGQRPEAEIEPLGRIVRACTAAGPVPARALGPPLWLPPRRPRVLAVRLEDGEGALGALQASLSAQLADAGLYEPERRPFLPHVTVARVRGAEPRPAPLPSPPALAFAGAAVTLHRSRPGPGGTRYEALARASLA